MVMGRVLAVLVCVLLVYQIHYSEYRLTESVTWVRARLRKKPKNQRFGMDHIHTSSTTQVEDVWMWSIPDISLY